MPVAPEIAVKKKYAIQKGYTFIALTILKSKYDKILCTVHF